MSLHSRRRHTHLVEAYHPRWPEATGRSLPNPRGGDPPRLATACHALPPRRALRLCNIRRHTIQIRPPPRFARTFHRLLPHFLPASAAVASLHPSSTRLSRALSRLSAVPSAIGGRFPAMPGPRLCLCNHLSYRRDLDFRANAISPFARACLAKAIGA